MDELEPYIEAKAKCAGTRGWIWQNALELSISITDAVADAVARDLKIILFSLNTNQGTSYSSFKEN